MRQVLQFTSSLPSDRHLGYELEILLMMCVSILETSFLLVCSKVNGWTEKRRKMLGAEQKQTTIDTAAAA